jgi:hypothetical protein
MCLIQNVQDLYECRKVKVVSNEMSAKTRFMTTVHNINLMAVILCDQSGYCAARWALLWVSIQNDISQQ